MDSTLAVQSDSVAHEVWWWCRLERGDQVKARRARLRTFGFGIEVGRLHAAGAHLSVGVAVERIHDLLRVRA